MSACQIRSNIAGMLIGACALLAIIAFLLGIVDIVKNPAALGKFGKTWIFAASSFGAYLLSKLVAAGLPGYYSKGSWRVSCP